MFVRTLSRGGPVDHKPDTGKIQYDGPTSRQSVTTTMQCATGLFHEMGVIPVKLKEV